LATIPYILTHADVEKTTQLVEILHRSKLQFVRLEAKGVEISISKGDSGTANGVEIGDQNGKPSHSIVLSSHVGVFRSGASQQKVSLDSQVEVASVLGFIQTLDESNTVYAGIVGRVSEIFVKDGDFIEFGQPLYTIRPSQKSAVQPTSRLRVKDKSSE
jgi:acetyl-CoA carboxylase biotin carboxyl carrier protein